MGGAFPHVCPWVTAGRNSDINNKIIRIVTFYNREEKSSRHVAMVAKFPDDNKPKTSLKKWICTVSNSIDLIQFHLNNYLENLGEVVTGWIPKDHIEKENFCAVFTNSVKHVHEIRKFVADLQRQQRNVQKSVIHVQSCCFANINRLLFCCSRCCRRCCCLSSLLLWSRHVATMVTCCHTSPLYF